MINSTYKNELLKLIMLICIVGLVFFSWYQFQNSLIIRFIYELFELLAGQYVNLLSTDLMYQNSILMLNGIAINKEIIIPEFTFPFLMSLIPVLYIYVRKNFLNLVVFVAVLLYFIVRAALITILFFSETSKEYQVLLNILDTIRYIPFYLIALYIVFNNQFFMIYYLRIKDKFDDVIQFDINIVVILLIMNSLPRILITFTFPELLDFVTRLILNISENTFNLFGINTIVDNKTIIIAENWIYLGHGCLGLGLMTMVIVLIAATKSPIINKLTFIFFLLPVQIIFNSIRIDLLLIYYYNNWDLTIKPMDMHDYSNVLIYSLGFGMFLLYYFWYQELKIFRKSNIHLVSN